jgi:DNA gyrase subunit A
MSLTSAGKMIRVDMQTIRKAGRNTSGVKVVSVEGKDSVVSIAKCPKDKPEDEENSEESGAENANNQENIENNEENSSNE